MGETLSSLSSFQKSVRHGQHEVQDTMHLILRNRQDLKSLEVLERLGNYLVKHWDRLVQKSPEVSPNALVNGFASKWLLAVDAYVTSGNMHAKSCKMDSRCNMLQ